MGLDRNNKEKQMEWDLHELEVVLPIEFSEEIKPSLFGLQEDEAQNMVSGLQVTFAEREVLKNAFIDIIELPINTENLAIFKELRLKIVKNRTQGIEKWHKTNKEFYLSGGRFVDAIKNKEILVNQQMEEKLMEAEKFFENQEKERVAKLQAERLEKVSPYLESVDGLDLTSMDDYVFDAFFEGSKSKFEAKKEAKLEADKLAKAPIKKQMNVWIDTFVYDTPLENETSKEILLKFEAFKNWAKSEINKL